MACMSLEFIKPQLATSVDHPPPRAGWIHEVKQIPHSPNHRTPQSACVYPQRLRLDWPLSRHSKRSSKAGLPISNHRRRSHCSGWAWCFGLWGAQVSHSMESTKTGVLCLRPPSSERQGSSRTAVEWTESEAEGAYPEWTPVQWRIHRRCRYILPSLCRSPLQTKKIKGLHENDFIMAAKLDQLASSTETNWVTLCL